MQFSLNLDWLRWWSSSHVLRLSFSQFNLICANDFEPYCGMTCGVSVYLLAGIQFTNKFSLQMKMQRLRMRYISIKSRTNVCHRISVRITVARTNTWHFQIDKQTIFFRRKPLECGMWASVFGSPQRLMTCACRT